MILYPTIQILGGRCVSLSGGRIDEPSVWHVDPVAMTRSFADAGASWMHLTDLDAVLGDERNHGLVEEIIRVAGIPVQLAGGFRSLEAIERWIEKGTGRIVVGTAAITQPDMVRKAARLHPDQIVVALDVWNGHVLMDGWRQESMFTPDALLESFAGEPLAAVLYTDVNTDVEEREVSVSELARLAGRTRLPIIASGLVHGADDVSLLKYAGHCEGALIGRALFSKTLDLRAALEIAQPDAAPRAAFI